MIKASRKGKATPCSLPSARVKAPTGLGTNVEDFEGQQHPYEAAITFILAFCSRVGDGIPGIPCSRHTSINSILFILFLSEATWPPHREEGQGEAEEAGGRPPWLLGLLSLR